MKLSRALGSDSHVAVLLFDTEHGLEQLEVLELLLQQGMT
jgi:hypothetical protein